MSKNYLHRHCSVDFQMKRFITAKIAPLFENHFYFVNFQSKTARGAWVAQSVECPTSAQVMISRSVSLSPASGSVLVAQSLEPASDSVSSSLSAPPLLALCLSVSVSLSNIRNIKKKFFLKHRIK